jgi:hypothetical protein
VTPQGYSGVKLPGRSAGSHSGKMPGGVDEVVEFVPPKKDAFHIELTSAGRAIYENGLFVHCTTGNAGLRYLFCTA